jgi:hypothetical protein
MKMGTYFTANRYSFAIPVQHWAHPRSKRVIMNSSGYLYSYQQCGMCESPSPQKATSDARTNRIPATFMFAWKFVLSLHDLHMANVCDVHPSCPSPGICFATTSASPATGAQVSGHRPPALGYSRIFPLQNLSSSFPYFEHLGALYSSLRPTAFTFVFSLASAFLGLRFQGHPDTLQRN